MDDFHPRLRADRTIFVFDLDNTLYPSSLALFPQVEKRMEIFVQTLTGLTDGEAAAYQKKLFMDYGTTLNGLMVDHNIDPQEFLDFVHDIDFSPISRDDKLRQSLEKLEGRRLIYTNADMTYTKKVLARLGISDLFEDIFDIHRGDLKPKPQNQPFDKFLSDHDIDPLKSIMFEDMARNLVPASDRGMGTVWINTGTDWGRADYHPDVVHAEIPALSDWLATYVTARGRHVG